MSGRDGRGRLVDGATGAFLAYLALAALVLVAFGVRLGEERADAGERVGAEGRHAQREDARLSPTPEHLSSRVAPVEPVGDGAAEPEATDAPGRPGEPDQPATGPRWRAERVFAPGRTLVAYYGTAGTGALGVLGEGTPERAHRRLVRAARPFAGSRTGREVVPVHELIVTIADAHPGRDGDYSHDIARSAVRRQLALARRTGALVVLDLQPGRADFAEVARRWAWALRQPHVGLALDPEWRMGPGQVPGRVIGSVRAREVNRVSGWLAALVRRLDLPEKPFVVHQFRTSMLPDIERIRSRDGLAMVQHVDGFGTRAQKLDTYRAVARPGAFAMGFKLFYDEDIRLMGPRAVHALDPKVRFVSYQ